MEKLPYFRSLDGLRAFAALSVFFTHYFTKDLFFDIPALVIGASYGNAGVSLFFVLSGFVITRILLQRVHTKNYFSSFYIRRSLRIFPLYFAGFFASFFFLPFFFEDQKEAAAYWPHWPWLYVFFLHNIAKAFFGTIPGPPHYWSLAVEEHFYLLWPFVVYFSAAYGKRALWFVSLLFVAISLVTRCVLIPLGYDMNIFTLSRMDQLAFGGMLALVEQQGLLSKKYTPYYLAIIAFGILGMGGVAISGSATLWGVAKHSMVGILFSGLILLAVSSEGHWLNKALLQNAWILYLGKISYGFYVWHVFCIFAMQHVFPVGRLLAFPLVFSASFLTAAISYRYLEEPFLKLKKKND